MKKKNTKKFSKDLSKTLKAFVADSKGKKVKGITTIKVNVKPR